jgi:hypothetical protein
VAPSSNLAVLMHIRSLLPWCRHRLYVPTAVHLELTIIARKLLLHLSRWSLAQRLLHREHSQGSGFPQSTCKTLHKGFGRLISQSESDNCCFRFAEEAHILENKIWRTATSTTPAAVPHKRIPINYDAICWSTLAYTYQLSHDITSRHNITPRWHCCVTPPLQRPHLRHDEITMPVYS